MNICSDIARWKRPTLARWTEAMEAVRQARPDPDADTAP